ncbi:sulfatase family protein [Chondrinema litorale]|uniref:sulfatase family protein n=1 Tax=Chondrinema litorale TaxID=2994555 RepID=UPI0025435C60|nr:sulfatase [Chondrinema litorale]UZR96268.1 sulfatase [Chondrinema litorale]
MKTTKYQKILSRLAIPLGFILGFIACTTPTKEPSEVPNKANGKPTNFIIIFADDLGYGDLSTFGHPTIRTPNLDRMAVEGQKWTNFYVGASVCTPSRAALLTGRLPIRNGMTSRVNRVLFPDSKNGLPQTEVTIAEQMKKAGYATAAIGKWHLGHKEEFLPTSHGFDYYYGIPYSNDMDNIIPFRSAQGYFDFWKSPERKDIKTFNVPLMRNTEIIERPADQNTITRRYTEEAMKFVTENKEKPFFLYLAHNLPHVPLFASNDFEGKSPRGLYGDVVEEIDFWIGELLNTLKENGLDKNTMVVFTSDNGPWLIMNQEGGSAGLLRDGKGSTWEGGMREPTIFWAPGSIKPGIVTDLGTTMDLFTTLSNMVGVPIPNDRIVDGLDLSGTLFEGKKSPRNDMFYYRGDWLYAVRVGDYKAHFITQEPYGSEVIRHDPPLLYNLSVDPSEKYDIAKENPEVIEQIREVMKAHDEKMVKGPDMLKDREGTSSK